MKGFTIRIIGQYQLIEAGVRFRQKDRSISQSSDLETLRKYIGSSMTTVWNSEKCICGNYHFSHSAHWNSVGAGDEAQEPFLHFGLPFEEHVPEISVHCTTSLIINS